MNKLEHISKAIIGSLEEVEWLNDILQIHDISFDILPNDVLNIIDRYI